MRLATLVMLMVAPLGVLAGCSSDCSMEHNLKDAAGSGAVACGKSALGDTATVGACMAQALADGKAFWGYQEGQGTDSTVSSGVACNGSQIWLFDYDGCPGGCGNGDPHLYRTDCVNPQAESNWIACDAAQRQQICP